MLKHQLCAHSTLLWLQMWTNYFLLWECADSLLLIIYNRLTLFLPFQFFNQWHFTSLRQSRNEKNYRDQSRLIFLASLLHQTPPCRITLLFIARTCDSKVSPLAGYSLCGKQDNNHKGFIFCYSITKTKCMLWLVNSASTICPWVYATDVLDN